MVRVFIAIVILKIKIVSYLSEMGWNLDGVIEVRIILLVRVKGKAVGGGSDM
jgi:hypothetical protein